MAESKEKTVEAAVEIVDDNVVDLKRPLANGSQVLKLDFDKINGYTLIACEKKAKKEDPTISVPAVSQIYQAYVAAAASGVKYDDILGLNGSDFTAVCIKTQGFLAGSVR